MLEEHKHCGICGNIYRGDFDWSKYLGEINFCFESFKPPLCDECYHCLLKERNYDG